MLFILRVSPNLLPFVRAACLFAIMLGFAGCRSAAHTDVYIDKLAAEVRFLEDQLYQIDYENKVLREKLMRAKRAAAADTLVPPKSILNLPDRKRNERNLDEDRDLPDDDIDLDLGTIRTPPSADLGDPRTTPQGDAPERDAAPRDDDVPDIKLPEIDPGTIRPPSDNLLIPPTIDSGNLIPPGMRG
ncbi:MAG: hypothetical protein R3C05_25910 [Pirellulaceae bacterium]